MSTDLKQLDPKIYDRAFEIYQEFGPERGTPVEERWHKRFPSLSESFYGVVKAQCRKIEEVAFTLGNKVFDKLLTYDQAKEELARTYPELTSERVDRTMNQGMYFASK